jgi:protein-S-isoprenylcysteine O-methyltransferase Ste14
MRRFDGRFRPPESAVDKAPSRAIDRRGMAGYNRDQFNVRDKMKRSPEAPEVLLFPPLIPLSVLLIGVLLGWLKPRRWLTRFGWRWRLGLGGLAVLAGAAIAIRGGRTLGRLGTPLSPSQPTVALATEGIFTRTRNPIYVGGGLALAGLAIGFALDWVLLLLLPSFVVLHYGVIVPEERYLERKFGGAYRRYKASAPRYGWLA